MFEGSVVGIFVAPAAGAPMEPRDEVDAIAGAGLAGDRYADAAGTYSGRRHSDARRAVTLIEREAIAAARSDGGMALDEHETRRNLVTVGVPLNHLVDREFLVGPVSNARPEQVCARPSFTAAACGPRSSKGDPFTSVTGYTPPALNSHHSRRRHHSFGSCRVGTGA